MVGDRSVGASLVGALGTLTNTGNHKGCPYMHLTYQIDTASEARQLHNPLSLDGRGLG